MNSHETTTAQAFRINTPCGDNNRLFHKEEVCQRSSVSYPLSCGMSGYPQTINNNEAPLWDAYYSVPMG